MANQNIMAQLPKVDQVLSDPILCQIQNKIPRTLILKIVRSILDELRSSLFSGQILSGSKTLKAAAVAETAANRINNLLQPNLRRVINATGVIIHTNLGRSLLAETVIIRLAELNRRYINLEYDLAKGTRGYRYNHIVEIIKEITGAEAAIVVNNNAAAVYLSLQSLAEGREVIVSRGQLVEIGGSFRIPDIMAKSGAILREVGTTNRTYLRDYEQAITSNTALLLKVHTSNFALVGFHQEVSLKELSHLASNHHLPLMEDLGSGTIIDLSHFGLPKEPTIQETFSNGVDLVTFSGDKLLGGPQAGLILGRANLIDKIRNNPLNRAMRIDKLTLAALEATLEIYRDPLRAVKEIPTLRMLVIPYKELRRRATIIARRLINLRRPHLKILTLDGQSRVGGGALPLGAPRTRLIQVDIEGLSTTRLEHALRSAPIPVITRLEKGHLFIDVRTLIKDDANELIKILNKLTTIL